MKTKITLRIAVIATILLAVFTSATNVQAQLSCNYSIVNNLNCPVTISYKAEDCSGNSTCSAFGQTIAANSTFFITASCCAASCNIFINVLTIGGNTVSQSPGAVNSGLLNAGGTFVGTCNMTPPNWTITWTNSGTTIN